MSDRHRNPRDRETAQNWARDLVNGGRFYVLDTETTGLDAKAEIVQIGLLDQDGNILLNTLVRPSRPIPPQVTKVHGIRDADVVTAPAMLDLYVSLSAMLAGVPLVAYNMDFDWRMIQQTLGLYGLPLFRTGARHCAMKRYAVYWGDWNNLHNSYRYQKLGEAARQQRIGLENAHDALSDCRATLALVHRMAR